MAVECHEGCGAIVLSDHSVVLCVAALRKDIDQRRSNVCGAGPVRCGAVMTTGRVLGEAEGTCAVGCGGGGQGCGSTLPREPEGDSCTDDRLISAVNLSAEGGRRGERV